MTKNKYNIFKNRNDNTTHRVLESYETGTRSLGEAIDILSEKEAPKGLCEDDYYNNVFHESAIDLSFEGDSVAELVREFKKALEGIVGTSKDITKLSIDLVCHGYDSSDNELCYHKKVALSEKDLASVKASKESAILLYGYKEDITRDYYIEKSKQATTKEKQRKANILEQIKVLEAKL